MTTQWVDSDGGQWVNPDSGLLQWIDLIDELEGLKNILSKIYNYNFHSKEYIYVFDSVDNKFYIYSKNDFHYYFDSIKIQSFTKWSNRK